MFRFTRASTVLPRSAFVASSSSLPGQSTSSTTSFRSQGCRMGMGMATAATSTSTDSEVPTRSQKNTGDIQALFSSLNPTISHELPLRFSGLKKELWRDRLIVSWKEVLDQLEVSTEEIISKGTEIIPRVSYEELRGGLPDDKLAQVKKTGVVVVTGAVPKEEALSWKKMIQDYASANKDLVRGFPAHDVQVYEFYNTKSQTLARTHPDILQTQLSLLSMWHTSNPNTEISLSSPISYFDRLRIRKPGDKTFTLGPHIDGGSVERWEDPGFRSCWRKILEGNWREHDPFDASPRISAKQDLYHAPNQCSVFRPWQGWTSMSTTGPNEGTLRVFPMLSLATAYLILRPFFRPRDPESKSLKFDDWEFDLNSPSFPGSGMGTGQELNKKTHPHLRLDKTMTAVPKVEPGDQVYWHCDVIHAVEFHHQGKGDSSVMYIPAVPLTTHNAGYLRDQRIHFVKGLPAPDFPGGEGESRFVGRGSTEDIKSRVGLQAYGFEPFDEEGSDFIRKANAIIRA